MRRPQPHPEPEPLRRRHEKRPGQPVLTTLGEVLRELGVTLVINFPAVAAASWPVVKGLPAVKGYLGQIAGEFYDGEMARSGGASA